MNKTKFLGSKEIMTDSVGPVIQLVNTLDCDCVNSGGKRVTMLLAKWPAGVALRCKPSHPTLKPKVLHCFLKKEYFVLKALFTVHMQ